MENLPSALISPESGGGRQSSTCATERLIDPHRRDLWFVGVSVGAARGAHMG